MPQLDFFIFFDEGLSVFLVFFFFFFVLSFFWVPFILKERFSLKFLNQFYFFKFVYVLLLLRLVEVKRVPLKKKAINRVHGLKFRFKRQFFCFYCKSLVFFVLFTIEFFVFVRLENVFI